MFIRLCLEFPKLHKWSEKIAYEAMGINFMNKQVTKSHDSGKYPKPFHLDHGNRNKEIFRNTIITNKGTTFSDKLGRFPF